MIKKIGLVLLCLVAILPYFFAGPHVRQTTHHPVRGPRPEVGATYRIAIMLPMQHPALDEIKQGFVDTLSAKVKVHYDVFVGNGNRALMRSQAEEIVQNNYDLVFAVSTVCALLIKEVTEQRGSALPIVFGAADDPVGNGIIQSLEASGNNCTGVTDYKDFEKQLGFYRLLLPKVKNILLVYNPTPGLIKQKNMLQKACDAQGISLTTCEIVTSNELTTKTAGLLKQFDSVLVLKDNFVVSSIEALIQLCDRFRVPLIVSDLNSVYKGAALAFGVHECEYGAASAHKALEILVEGKQPSALPTLQMQNFKIVCNQTACEQQQLAIDDQLLFLMKNSEVIA